MGGFDNLQPEFASRLQAMMDAARAEGRSIGIGSGYRTVEEQIALRRKNGCPDVWTSPASSCRVPTAIPGRSRHNMGLAADITGDKDWANANAARFGLVFNVQGEDWHVEMSGEGNQGVGPNGEPISFGFDYMDQPANPQDELANRLHSVMRIIGSGTQPVDTPADMLDPTELGTDVTTAAPVPGAAAPASGGGPDDPNGYGAYAKQIFAKYGWDENEYRKAVALWNRESGDPKAGESAVTWNPLADNPTSTAFGIAQFLDGTWEGTGYQKTSDWRKQIEAGAAYIASRYGAPSAALTFHDRNNWY